MECVLLTCRSNEAVTLIELQGIIYVKFCVKIKLLQSNSTWLYEDTYLNQLLVLVAFSFLIEYVFVFAQSMTD